MSGQCCGVAPRYNRDSKWYCSECDGYVGDPETQVDFSGWIGYNSGSKLVKKCTCGAEITYGPNATHTDYCDKSK